MITYLYIYNEVILWIKILKIEVVSGNGKDLNISEVSTHISTLKPKSKNNNGIKQEIVIPKKKSDNKK